jgi:hypothetical protein
MLADKANCFASNNYERQIFFNTVRIGAPIGMLGDRDGNTNCLKMNKQIRLLQRNKGFSNAQRRMNTNNLLGLQNC